MANEKIKLTIDALIQIVEKGGRVKTGIDIYSKSGVLLLDKDALVNTPKPLLLIKRSGITDLLFDPREMGGLWDQNGNPIEIKPAIKPTAQFAELSNSGEVEKRVKNITELKNEASRRYLKAKENIKKVISDIRRTGGKFDYETVEHTVTDLVDFISDNNNAFFYLTKDIFSYDDYLYHHAINVCTIGTAILKKFTAQFETDITTIARNKMFQISIGYFLHDVGKVLIPDHVLNKTRQLTPEEFAVIKTHSYEKGQFLLELNGIKAPEIQAIVKYHHSAIQKGELNYYPDMDFPEKLPAYVKICKLADMYDAMTSKRCYKEAYNPVSVVTNIVRKYATKDQTLRYILHSFVKAIGIYPAGSVVRLTNHQLAYVLDSEGPLVIPFTGVNKVPLTGVPAPVDMENEKLKDVGLSIDMDTPLLSPIEAYALLPEHMKQMVLN